MALPQQQVPFPRQPLPQPHPIQPSEMNITGTLPPLLFMAKT